MAGVTVRISHNSGDAKTSSADRMRLHRARKKMGVRVAGPLEISNDLLLELVDQGQLDEYDIDTPDGLATAMSPLLDDKLEELVLKGRGSVTKGQIRVVGFNHD